MATKFNFTKQRIEALKPAAARAYYQDERTEGLSVCVTPSGGRIFYCVKWHEGRKVRLRLGTFPAVTIEQARRQCQKAVAKMAEGIDPQAARQAARHEDTVKGLWEHWLEHAKAHKRTWQQDKRKYERFLESWASRQLSSIHKSDVVALHKRIGKDHGRYLANRTVDLISAMFAKAGEIGYRGDNPAKGIEKFREEKRDRFLQGDELPAFFQALAAEPSWSDFFLVALLTGARRSNVQTMKWDDIDAYTATWRIPSSEAKAGVPINVPLVAPVLAILASRKKARNGSPYVFPTRSKTGHIVEPKSAWKRVLKRAGLVNVRIHDLRRSLGSWQAIGGSSMPVIGRSLGHTQTRTTEIYARLSMDPVRQSVDSATTAMLSAANANIDGNNGSVVIDVLSGPADAQA